MNPLEAYLKEMRDIHGTGAAVAETSYYNALTALLNENGKTLKPKVRCVLTIENRGAGLPDGGLFTAEQIKKDNPNPMRGQLPARGVLEVKGPADDVKEIASRKQVNDYLGKYGLVLISNYRDFLLLGKDVQGNPVPKERYTLAKDEGSFWLATVHPEKTAQEHGELLCDYLKRVMLSVAPLSAPQDLAWFLASYARDAKARVEKHKDLSALAAVREAIEEALGMKFAGEKGEHFFRSTLVQTIFYGIFSAWVLWHRERPDRTDHFDWRVSAYSLRVPFIRALYDQIATPKKLGDLGIIEVLDWTASALNRVNRAAFFQKFQEEHAVEYFYEPFLEAFDPELRKELGVWYTPPEIIKYQVGRADSVIRAELGLSDGLADPSVVVLDPCCGTGGYLIEVLRKIAETLKAKGGDALIASDLKKAAMTRVFGFEILPAPFVVSHLQLGLELQEWGAPLSIKGNERVGVYLTNSLTGWEPPQEPKQKVLAFMKELQEERDAAGEVKRGASVLVILGNPPYNAFAGVSPEEEHGLVEPYKAGLNLPLEKGGWGIRKFNLDDLYVRFFRLAERRIIKMNQPAEGIISFITNFSYLGDPSFVVMRQRFLAEFDRLWFDCMNGDSRETGKLTPDGKPDPSVFSTEYNREGIRVGTAICLAVRKEKRDKAPEVRFRHLWGTSKRHDLLNSLTMKPFDDAYARARPIKENRFSFRPEEVSEAYASWPKLPNLCEIPPFNGLMEKRGGALIDIDKAALEARMKDYFSANFTWEEYKTIHSALVKPQARFDPRRAREKALSAEQFDHKRIIRYSLRPFDTRWCYYTGVRPVWNEPRPALWEQYSVGNFFLVCRPSGVSDPEGVPFCSTALLGDNDFQRGHAYYFPEQLTPGVRLKKARGKDSLLTIPRGIQPESNLSSRAREYLAEVEIGDPDTNTFAARAIWLHCLAIGYSPAYLFENADGIKRDWPKIPLPASRAALEESASMGLQIASLLNTECEVPGVTTGKIDRFLRTVGLLTRVGGGMLDPDAGDLALTAGWGHSGKGGVTMPAKGRTVLRPFDASELEALGAAGSSKTGKMTFDIYLNDKAYWKNVPLKVWEYYIGGYQVIKKWLSYREQELLGRALDSDEAREVTGMARRLAQIVLLQPSLDANYHSIAANAFMWSHPE